MKAMDNLFTKSILRNPIMKASEIVRYSGIEYTKREDVLQHTAQVTLMAYFMGLNILQMGDSNLDIGLLLEMSILHDVDEVITGDIPRPTKYFSEDITNGIQMMAKKSSELLINKYSGLDDQEYIDRVLNSIENCKEGPEGAIIAVADLLGVAYKCYEEVVLLSNNKFVKVTNDLVGYLSELSDKLLNGKYKSELSSDSIAYLDELVQGALEVTLSVLEMDMPKAVLDLMDYNGHSLASTELREYRSSED